MKPIEMLICSGCGEYAGSHIDAVIGGLQSALSEAIARAERAEEALLEIAEQTKGVTHDLIAHLRDMGLLPPPLPVDRDKRGWVPSYLGQEPPF